MHKLFSIEVSRFIVLCCMITYENVREDTSFKLYFKPIVGIQRWKTELPINTFAIFFGESGPTYTTDVCIIFLKTVM